MVDAGWLGIAMLTEFGSGLGITEAAVMMQAVAESGAGMGGASSIHLPVFGLQPVVLFGTEEQKQRILPAVIRGEHKVCFACHAAMLTLGGMGYAQEYPVERYLREVLIPRAAPISPHMILNYLAEKVPELPKSY